MSAGLPGSTPLGYTGIPVNVVPIKVFPRQPIGSDNRFPLGQKVIVGVNPSTGTEGDLWYLSRFDSNGEALWLQVATGASSPGVDFLESDDGAPPVEPDGGGIIDVLGGNGIITSGQSPSTSLTLEVDTSTVGQTLTADSGGALSPIAGNWSILGGSGIDTSGASNIVTIDVDGNVVTSQFDTDSGSATPTAGILDILGGTGLDTSGAGNVVTVDLDGNVVTSQFDTDSGSATPTAGVLDILGGTGLSTSGAGNAVTVDLDTPVSVTDGGSGRSSATTFSVICGGTVATGAHQSVASVGTAAQVLTSNGAGALPTFQDAGGGGGGGVWEFVSTATASNDATIEFNNLTAASYKVVILNMVPDTGTELQIRMSDDNGSTFETTNYQYTWYSHVLSVFGNNNSLNAAFFLTTEGIATGAGQFGLNGEVNFWSINTVSEPAFLSWCLNYQNSISTGGQAKFTCGEGITARPSDAGNFTDIDAIQFFMSSGNIGSGIFHLYSLVTS